MEAPSRPIPTTIRSPPSLGDFVPIAEHQAQTPETFFGGKPVLHHHAEGATAYIPKSQRHYLPIFPADAPENAAAQGLELTSDGEKLIDQKVDIFVNSETLTLFAPDAERGVTIPYPLISIHAIKTLESGAGAVRSVFLLLELSDGGADDETYETVELTIVPPGAAPGDAAPSEPPPPAAAGAQQQSPSPTSRLFDAISACADLHPDAPPSDSDDGDYADRIYFEPGAGGDGDGLAPDRLQGYEGVYRGAHDGGLPPPLPGSSGWITADNVHEYFDGEGNWIGGAEDGEDGVSGELGDGAGRVRGRDEVEQADAAAEGVNGHGAVEGDGENKRPRTE